MAVFKLAHEPPGQTLQPTALVHEAWLRLAGQENQAWNGRPHFFGAAAEAMRRILIDNARRKRAPRHGGGHAFGSMWGYTSDDHFSGPGAIINALSDTVSKNGTLLADGQWLGINGKAIYGTHNWTKFDEGGEHMHNDLTIRFTVNGKNLYAIILGNWPGAEAIVTLLNEKVVKIEAVTQLGGDGQLELTQDAGGFKIEATHHGAG